MVLKRLVLALLAFPLLAPGMASALVVEIQGVRLEPTMVGASCVDIVGVYPGLRIEADRPGQIPRICYSSAQVNSISLSNATLVAMPPAKQEILIKFEHEFPPGINGKIMARAKLKGFFATANGIDVPTGDKLGSTAYFSQGKATDVIAEPLDFKVGDAFETALFDYSVKEEYLTAGPRALKGAIKIVFTSPGHKLTFPDKCLISLDTGSRFEDKLESFDEVEDDGDVAPEESGPLPAPRGTGGTEPKAPVSDQKPSAPGTPLPLPELPSPQPLPLPAKPQ